AKSCRKSGDQHRRFHSRSTAGLAVAVIEPAERGAAGLGIANLWVARPGDCSAVEDWFGPLGAHLPGRAGQKREGWSASWCASSAPLEIEDRPCPLRFSLSGKVPTSMRYGHCTLPVPVRCKSANEEHQQK